MSFQFGLWTVRRAGGPWLYTHQRGRQRKTLAKEAEKEVSEERDQRWSQKPRWVSPKGQSHMRPLHSLSEANRVGWQGKLMAVSESLGPDGVGGDRRQLLGEAGCEGHRGGTRHRSWRHPYHPYPPDSWARRALFICLPTLLMTLIH